ncbi:MAG: S-layer homology domain-containing protein, partial [Firmicutes bacterium]|nr:S-layer homology domain-containing protein [Bacillota bacterium]
GEDCPAVVFSDVKLDDWSHDGIHYCVETKLMKGVGEGLFAPNTVATRGMIITMLYRVEFGENAPAYNGEIKFSDLEEGKWYTDAMIWATEKGILKGLDDGTCRPNQEINREQMASFLYRYAVMKNAVPAGDHDLILAFPADGHTVSNWAVDAMSWATGTGLIKGIGGGALAPQADATRAQVAAVFYRLIEEVL